MASRIVSVVKLPNELLTIVFANLKPNDLKASRLVCRLWSMLAITKLFERIYVSCRLKDLNVFQLLSSHAVCRKAVRRLVYDASTTSDAIAGSKVEYVWSLRLHLEGLTGDRHVPGTTRSEVTQALSLSNSECLYYFYECAKFPERLTKEDNLNMSDIIGGYNAYCTLARQEKDAISSGQLLATLVHGLRGLINLEEIVLTGDTCDQSPFSRSWPLTHLIPGYGGGESRSYKEMHNHSHNLLARALSTSGRKIKTFIATEWERFEDGIPLQFFDMNYMAHHKEITSYMLEAYSSLTSLSLQLTPRYTNVDKYESTNESNWLFLEMPHLMHLTLHVEFQTSPYPELLNVPYNILRPSSCPQLRHLSLSGIKFSKKQLIGFLETRSLRSLILGPLELDEDSWVPTLDSIRSCAQRPLHISIWGIWNLAAGGRYCYNFFHRDDGLKGKIESYLNFGGVNPFLLEEDSSISDSNISTFGSDSSTSELES